jgi:alpha-glucosidase/glucan 1,6-alpha-glucosidase
MLPSPRKVQYGSLQITCLQTGMITPTAGSIPVGAARLTCFQRPRIHEYLQEMHEEVFSHYDCMTLAEMSCGVSAPEAVRYTSRFNSRPELNLVIQFQHVELDCHDGDKWMLREWELPELKRIINEWQETLVDNGGWNTVWMENHDQPRGISRFTTNSPRFRALCAKLLALWQFTLQGTNLIFQGQELGMINPGLFSEEMNQDIETIQYWKAYVSLILTRHIDQLLT